MLRYILKRLWQMIPVFIIISIVIFGIIEMMPGDSITIYIGDSTHLNAAQIEQMKENLGLNKPPWQRYFIWMRNMLTGEFGTSTMQKQPVSSVIGTYIWNSFFLNFIVLIISFSLAIVIGITSAVKKGKLFDNFFQVFSMIFISIPTFIFGLFLIYFFAVKINLFPMNGMITPGYLHKNLFERIADISMHMILPGFVLVLANLGSYIKYVRSSMLEVIDEDYIRTARAKGLSQNAVIYKHAFRNALIPIVTLFGSAIGAMFTGALMLESVFIWPGMGGVMVSSITHRDIPLMLVLFLFYAITSLIGNLLADIGYAIVDPRVRLGA